MLTHPTPSTVPPILVFAWGNPSRGDDAIGPYIKNLLAKRKPDGVELLTDFQLQIEHAVDLEHRASILFVDASISARPPFEFTKLEPDEDIVFTTHAMSPRALMTVYRKVNQKPPPPCYLLSVRAYRFALGQPLSDTARQHATQAAAFILRFIEEAIDDSSL